MTSQILSSRDARFPDFGLYVHWPFCVSKCPYCDFNSHVHSTIDIPAYTAAYLQELTHMRALSVPRSLVSLYFGGGTPSLMPPSLVAAMIQKISELWSFAPQIEITLEANPHSTEIEKFQAFRDAGINRLSIGVQSFDDKTLRFLGRPHSAAEGKKAVQVAQKVFDRVTFDLIYALPDQTLNQWKDVLKEALYYGISHHSLYQLTIEPNTPFERLHQSGKLVLPEDSLQADFYQLTEDVMNEGGYSSYEVSNYAQPGAASQHNILYWNSQDWGAVGPGAHGRVTTKEGRFALRRHRAPTIWQEQCVSQGHAMTHWEKQTALEQAEEYLMMGLRLKEGISLTVFEKIVGTTLPHFVQHENFSFLKEEGFLDVENGMLRATMKGRLCLGTVLKELLL
ncbi:radical SAM family heme chaperone HemW [Alphaproteobacteria bacterium]|nr:radical SAM family heme chaperone HemW [Alphaproteobacteria bacterium]